MTPLIMGLVGVLGCGPLGQESNVGRLVLQERQIWQKGSGWRVRYRLGYEGAISFPLYAHDIECNYAGWVSNSRVWSHAYARQSRARFGISKANGVLTTVIPSASDRLRCGERITLALAVGDQPPVEYSPTQANRLPLWVVAGHTIWLDVTLEHEHFLYGAYDVLLGPRQLEIQMGPCRLIDYLRLEAEQVSVVPAVRLSQVPKERLDGHQRHSAPDSLYLTASIAGYQYFRFDDMPIRYGTTCRLSFWYLIAIGTEGSCHVRVTEYQDTAKAWFRLDGGFDEQLALVGQWRRFERTFVVRDDATTLALDFRIVGANVGELWINNLELMALPVEEEL